MGATIDSTPPVCHPVVVNVNLRLGEETPSGCSI